jgi:hypothetical protein
MSVTAEPASRSADADAEQPFAAHSDNATLSLRHLAQVLDGGRAVEDQLGRIALDASASELARTIAASMSPSPSRRTARRR